MFQDDNLYHISIGGDAPDHKLRARPSAPKNKFDLKNLLSFFRVNIKGILLCYLLSLLATISLSLFQALIDNVNFWIGFIVILVFICSSAGAILLNREIMMRYDISRTREINNLFPYIHIFLASVVPAILVVSAINIFETTISTPWVFGGGYLTFAIGILYYSAMAAQVLIANFILYLNRFFSSIKSFIKHGK